ncbi:heavy metal translocating P-type ATPase [Caldinitratiruptor microaerophilus]|uniref:Cd(2+)-exporting ATPase n=1 Tax=Caldinitratiruptor microaerophilus TaxID=671077 RepID=A0AA35GAD8_9FIRM|nr:heavy metal translocating P-type ATPase [Caldinitratiruptor microaerophilus]BDG61189.1 zinc-transporting ATPase [Caldinitratiruptor microaerophilus]
MAREKLETYVLEGLDCASCVARIEDALRREGVEDVSVSFATGRILLPPDQVERAQSIIDRVEPGVAIVRGHTRSEADAEAATPTHHPEQVRARGQEEDEVVRGRRLVELVASGLLFAVGIAFNRVLHATPYAVAEYATLLMAYLLAGRRVIRAAVVNARRGQLFDENFLMTIATLGAIAIHELPEAVAVMLFFSVGEFFQALAVARSRRSIRALMEIRPDYANVRRGGETRRVSPETVGAGEEIVVRPGERIPLDGEIVEGSSFVDTSALTGESVPRPVGIGDNVLAGMVNTRGLLVVRVTRPFAESSVAKILALVEEAAARKAPTERFITTFSRYYTPAVVLGALALAVIPPLVVPGAQFGDWLRRALVLLVISCPCALVVSIPLGYFGGIGGASRRGVLVKGGNYLDALAKLDTVVWDKTGTLTRGVFRVVEVTSFGGYSRDQVLELAAHAETFSNHPIAAPILEAYGRPVNTTAVSDYEEVAGHGVRARVGGRLVLAGNERLMRREGVPYEGTDRVGTIVHLAVDGRPAGRIVIADEPKPDAAEAIRALRGLGVRRQVMLTGDDRTVAGRVAQSLGLDEVYANLLPEEKVAAVERIDRERRERGGRRRGALAFVGDGINDAPVLTRADVGVAMGGLGSDAAIEAADVVIMDDSPLRLADAVTLARATRRVILQNVAFALGVKAVFVRLGAAGVANMWEAVFADVGVSLLAILNATRILRVSGRGGSEGNLRKDRLAGAAAPAGPA